MTDADIADEIIASADLQTMSRQTAIEFYLHRISHIITLRKERYEELNDTCIIGLDRMISGAYYMLCSLGQERQAWHTIQDDLT